MTMTVWWWRRRRRKLWHADERHQTRRERGDRSINVIECVNSVIDQLVLNVVLVVVCRTAAAKREESSCGLKEFEIGSSIFDLNKWIKKRIARRIEPKKPKGDFQEKRRKTKTRCRCQCTKNIREKKDQEDENKNEKRSRCSTISTNSKICSTFVRH